jgi:aminoglycoside phosphotransferase family enzyme/predicted kinase
LASLLETSERLIEALRSPAAYPHSVEQIEVLQTHISWVILTGEFAYKLKKPVDMGFLDFTTLERRRFYCQEELRLNRRLAPQLYLDVAPITGTPTSPRVAGEGEAIEYAVQMRQFPQDALLSRVLARGELVSRHIDSLARQLADFHRSAGQAAAGSELGSWESLQRANDETLVELEFAPEDVAAADRLRHWCRRELATRRAPFSARQQQGFVRECHGDLHLGNMLLWNDEPLVFDCIEFNDPFRWIDVLSEIAFAVMDLADRGSPRLARRLLNRYLEHTGDYEGVGLLRYYLVYRAIVRAKVACLRLRQMKGDDPRRDAKLAEYRGYLILAERYCHPDPPTLVITHGFSGSGKTTVSDQLVERLDAIRVRSDVERKRLHGLQPLERSQSGLSADLYTAAKSQQTYDRLVELATAILDGGFSVIVDAAFLKRTDRQTFQRLAQQRHVPWQILDVTASVETLRSRVQQRAAQGHDASEANLLVLEHQLQTADPLDATELACAVTIDSQTATPLDSIAEQFAPRRRG